MVKRHCLFKVKGEKCGALRARFDYLETAGTAGTTGTTEKFIIILMILCFAVVSFVTLVSVVSFSQKRQRLLTIRTLPSARPNFLREGVRLGLDKEIAPDGTYLAYFPFAAMIERSRMAPYREKLFLVRRAPSATLGEKGDDG